MPKSKSKKKASVKRDGANLTFNINGGRSKRDGLSMHLGLLELNLDKQYADMTMREIAQHLAEHFKIGRGEIEFHNISFAERKASRMRGRL